MARPPITGLELLHNLIVMPVFSGFLSIEETRSALRALADDDVQWARIQAVTFRSYEVLPSVLSKAEVDVEVGALSERAARGRAD